MDTPAEIVRFYRDRMIARSDVYALQLPSSIAKALGSKKDWGYFTVDDSITDALLEMHVRGDATVGVYNLSKESEVLWVCFDFDQIKDQPDKALENANKVFQYLRGTRYADAAMLEFSGRGYHIWVFFSELVDAGIARETGRQIIRDSELDIAVEVFPKQVRLSQRGYGNLVKLPFGINRKNGVPSDMYFPKELSKIKPIDVQSDKWKEYAETLDLLNPEDLEWETPKYLNYPCWRTIATTKFPKGKRNMVAFKVACLMKQMGLPRDMVFGALWGWNLTNDPPMEHEELNTIVNSAFGGKYSVGCQTIRGDALVQKFCKASECPLGNRVLTNEQTRLPRESDNDLAKWYANYGDRK